MLSPDEEEIIRNSHNTPGFSRSAAQFDEAEEAELEPKSGPARFALRFNRVFQTALIVAKFLHAALDKNASDQLIVYRIYGGRAGLFSVNDKTTGTFFLTEDPTGERTKIAVRQRRAIARDWNDITQVAMMMVDVRDVTSAGEVTPQFENGIFYKGGGLEVQVIDAQSKVHVIFKNRPSSLSGPDYARGCPSGNIQHGTDSTPVSCSLPP